jgi:tetratricopeptide (TPR) repeat protein
MELAKSLDYKAAQAAYDTAVKKGCDEALVFFKRGIALNALGDRKGAIADYDRALELRPLYPQCHLNRGNSKLALRDLRSAIDDYTRAIEQRPGYAKGYGNRAMVRAMLGDYGGAIEDATRALETKPDWARTYRERGDYRDKGFGDYRGALADYRKSLRYDPGNEKALRSVERLQRLVAGKAGPKEPGRTIVPGKGVMGVAEVGGSFGATADKLGQPDITREIKNRRYFFFRKYGVLLVSGERGDDSIYMVQLRDARYSTKNGLSVGATRGQVVAGFGSYTKRVDKKDGTYQLIYRSGITFILNQQDRVKEINLFPPF